MKKYECVRTENHSEIGNIVDEYQKNGWSLHTYQAAGMGAGPLAYKVYHFLLFEKEV